MTLKVKIYNAVTFFLITAFFSVLQAQNISIERIDPPFWWAGMKNNKLQLLVKGEHIDKAEVNLNFKGAKIINITQADNPKYLFIDLIIDTDINPCSLPISFKNASHEITYNYELKAREKRGTIHSGFSNADLIYLVLPDRFANGDPSNDVVKGMNEERMHRDSMFYRHGGDIQGIIDKLDYIYDLGMTALWLNPVFENNQPFASYHGYAITDHYKVDPRLGSNELYKKLVGKCHDKGIKVIKDLVFNHVGNRHWFYLEKPFEDWTNEHDTFTFSNFRVTTLLDPYASKHDLNTMAKGWFDRHMPDLNHSNPFLATYLIQNSIWWIEYAGLNGFRLDTYAYSDLSFMSDFARAVYKEYPDFNMIGEVWDNGIAIQAFFTKDSCNNRLLNTHLKGVTDFQLYHAINNTLSEEYGWNKGVERIYYTLCSDFVYDKPFNNLIFLDNHDLSRFYSVAGENMDKFKMGLGFLFTTRGVPMIYYGTEILMKNFKGPDEKVREDFPGGWESDAYNKFEMQGRTALENEAFYFVRKLANWRKNNAPVRNGKLTQFVPEDGVYVYFRHSDEGVVMIAMNASSEKKEQNTIRFTEILGANAKGINIINDEKVDLNNAITLAPWQILIIDIQ